jgi:xanthine dehydrogenase YagR molybdenum-binding subunit
MIGEARTRLEGRAKVTGAARFAADHRIEPMLHAVVVPAPVPAGRVRRIDARAALAVQGVSRVLTHSDMPAFGEAPTPPLASSFMPMQGDEIRYPGQPVALVLADTLLAAEHAAALVQLECEASAFAPEIGGSDIESAIEPPAGSPYSFGLPIRFDKGSVATALAGSALRLSETYVQPSRHHNAMETSAVMAEWDGRQLTVHDAVQAGFLVRMVLAAMLKLDAEQIRVIAPHTGGGFGAKGFVWPHEVLAAAAAMRVGRPVRLQLPRAQQYSNVGYQARTVQTMVLGADIDGRLRALAQDVVNLAPASDAYMEAAAEAGRSMYAAEAIRTRTRVVQRNVNIGTPMRAPVEGVGLWAVESAMNELAHRSRVDPLALRLLNHADVDPADGRPWSSKQLRKAYEEGARLFGWHERHAAPRQEGRWRIGHGMASCSMGCFRNPWKVHASLRADGTALIEAGFHDIGTGSATVLAQIAAEALGMAIAKIEVRHGDTALAEAGPTFGSSTTMGAAGAICDAARQLRDALAGLAGMPADQARLRDAMIGVPGEPAMAPQLFSEVLKAAGRDEVSVEGTWAPEEGGHSLRNFGAVFVEVGVDPELGLLRLRRAVGSYSAGRIVNPLTARAQMIGGIIWGWGKAAMEQSEFEPRLGRWLSQNLSGVVLPVNADIPAHIDIHFVDEFDRHASPIGAKGIGELGATGVDAAVADAVFQATGKRIRELPITPDKLIADAAPGYEFAETSTRISGNLSS